VIKDDHNVYVYVNQAKDTDGDQAKDTDGDQAKDTDGDQAKDTDDGQAKDTDGDQAKDTNGVLQYHSFLKNAGVNAQLIVIINKVDNNSDTRPASLWIRDNEGSVTVVYEWNYIMNEFVEHQDINLCILCASMEYDSDHIWIGSKLGLHQYIYNNDIREWVEQSQNTSLGSIGYIHHPDNEPFLLVSSADRDQVWCVSSINTQTVYCEIMYESFLPNIAFHTMKPRIAEQLYMNRVVWYKRDTKQVYISCPVDNIIIVYNMSHDNKQAEYNRCYKDVPCYIVSKDMKYSVSYNNKVLYTMNLL
jgi:hypothetical protein